MKQADAIGCHPHLCKLMFTFPDTTAVPLIGVDLARGGDRWVVVTRYVTSKYGDHGVDVTIEEFELSRDGSQ